MEDRLITFDTAKLAKEKGFNEITGSDCWIKTLDGKIIHNDERHPVNDDRVDDKYYLSQPTQTLLQTWLRKKHKVIVSVDIQDNDKYFLSTTNLGMYGNYDSWEEALEEGLKDELTLIKDI